MDSNTLAKVEQQRVELEGQVAQLRKSLRHWQTWEIEYEGLKEEILLLPAKSTSEDFFKAAQDFKAELVDDNEIKSLLGINTGKLRTQQQIADIISRRIDYVTKNSQTVQKQLSEAEKKRNALLLFDDSDLHDDPGLPVTEITEQLDEDGNVLSFTTNTAADKAPQLLEVLNKAGVKELLESDGMIRPVLEEKKKPSEPEQIEQPPTDETVQTTDSSNAVATTSEATSASHPRSEEKATSKPTQSASSTQLTKEPESSENTTTSEALTESSKQQFEAQLPEDEPEDEAALRREMIDYQSGLEEVGAIVAELELDEGGSDDGTYDDDLEDYDDMSFDETESDESEDEWGRSKKSPFTDKYIQKMLSLEKKLNARGLQNLGPNPDLPEQVRSKLDQLRPAQVQDTDSKVVEPSTPAISESSSKAKKPKKSNKKVSFASELDIAPDKPSVAKSSVAKPSVASPLNDQVLERNTASSSKVVSPLNDQVLERSTASSSNVTPPQGTTKKMSRFKKDRTGVDQPTTTSGPQPSFSSTEVGGKPLADTILERSTGERPQAPSFDEIDDRIHRQEIASEYHQLRSRMIHRQGGFIEEREQDQEQVPLPEEMGGKKMSRFKAARLK